MGAPGEKFQAADLPVSILTQYVRDVSFENPNAPDSLRGGQATPELDVNIGMDARKLPDQDIKVVDCFVSSEHVGAVVDDVIAHKDRLLIDAVWLQKGVVDEAAAARAAEAGLEVVMDTCPKIEWRRMSSEGQVR